MSERQKNRSQFRTASCIGQVKCEAARKDNSEEGCANRSTASSWREAAPALSSAVGVTWGGSAGRQSQQSQALRSAAWQEDERWWNRSGSV